MYTYKLRKPLKRSYIASQSKSERSVLIRQADAVFSVYVRQRGAIDNIAKCVTCGAKEHWKYMHNGHYISRRILATRFNIINCNVQCPNCNVNLRGNLKEYREYLIGEYGLEKILELEKIARKPKKMSIMDIKSIISIYKGY